MKPAPKRVAVTMGDPTGIGPEIVVKTFASASFIRNHPSFVVGDLGVLSRQVAALGLPLDVVAVSSVARIDPRPGVLEVLNTSDLPADLPWGTIHALAGKAAFDAVRTAIELAMRNEIAGICTAPIHKGALATAEVRYPGHTEMFAELSGTRDYAMMLINGTLRTILVTTHCSMLDAIAKLSIEGELRIIRLAQRALRTLGIARPRIAVAGLNPHAGEGGLFGCEERDIIEPAISAARAEGIDATGPWPGDTVFMSARGGLFDIVVSQYHDQGLIPLKLGGLEDGVNITIGLPFVRTSPDHGTAFNIAGQGVADPRSLKAALETAHRLIRL